ncbi:glycosyltransferase family 2 protein [Reichenbachiella sp.]|uniref:glycosyltransferase family 2 protein n=1 Tax=Reichenbachiella sp. TaxID=2184521 RepID=UPI003BB0EC80
MLVSIILPYCNSSLTLKRATQSILNQSYQNFELLLINNNSFDKSEDVARSLAKTNPKIKLLTENQQGVVFAANSGMKVAQGRYIARMDADDLAYPERLERQLKHLESNPDISISATQVRYQTENEDLGDFSHFVEWSNKLITWEDVYQNRFVEFPVVNPTLMFRKSLLEDVGYMKEGNFPEDYEWFLRALNKGHKIEKLPHPLLDWNDSPNRLTRTDSRYSNDAFFQIKSEYLAKHLKLINQTKVWVWGAGKLGYKRSQYLLDHDIKIAGYIDIKKDKQLRDYPCVHFKDIKPTHQPFIVSYITNRNRRDEVRDFLKSEGYKEGLNYIIAG